MVVAGTLGAGVAGAAGPAGAPHFNNPGLRADSWLGL